MTFLERADAFWNWFAGNEAELRDRVEHRERYDPQEAAQFVSRGTALISDELYFNIGGDCAFTFTVEGRSYLFYLLPWLVTRMPERFRDRWTFYPCMQGCGGENFDFEMDGVRVSMSDVLVGMDYDADADRFDLRYFSEPFADRDGARRGDAFAIMLELMIGEGMARIYVQSAEPLPARTEDMFPLTELERRMDEAIAEAGRERHTRPDECYTAYQFEPQEDAGPRLDTITGTTCFVGLVDEFFAGEAQSFEAIASCGAAAAYLSFPYGEDDDRSAVLNARFAIADRLESEVLGARGSGEELGIVLGGAMGTHNAYIDLLLYDEPAFLEKARGVLAEYPYAFAYAPFKRGELGKKL